MKAALKARLLHYLAYPTATHPTKKKFSPSHAAGFTLIELLVVIIIIGILSAIALPSFLNQANKARQAEAATYVGSMNRGQQTYYLKHRRFAPTRNDLELGIPATTDNYTYDSVGNANQALSTASPRGNDLKGYAGRAWLGTADDGTATTKAILCEGEPGLDPPDLSGAEDCP